MIDLSPSCNLKNVCNQFFEPLPVHVRRLLFAYIPVLLYAPLHTCLLANFPFYRITTWAFNFISCLSFTQKIFAQKRPVQWTRQKFNLSPTYHRCTALPFSPLWKLHAMKRVKKKKEKKKRVREFCSALFSRYFPRRVADSKNSARTPCDVFRAFFVTLDNKRKKESEKS